MRRAICCRSWGRLVLELATDREGLAAASGQSFDPWMAATLDGIVKGMFLQMHGRKSARSSRSAPTTPYRRHRGLSESCEVHNRVRSASERPRGNELDQVGKQHRSGAALRVGSYAGLWISM